MSTLSNTLPHPAAAQNYMIVSALEAGFIDIPSHLFVKDVPHTETHMTPSLSFFLRHSKSDEHLIFDLGIRKDIENSILRVQKLVGNVLPVTVSQDVRESLIKGGINPTEIKTVIFSHVHCDHVGDSSLFPNATFITGEGSLSLLANGFPSNPSSSFLTDTIPPNRGRFLSAADFSTSVACFPHAHDFFGDGSLYIVDAPGHLDGHINILARTSSDGAWIYLGGDTAPDCRLLSGAKEMTYNINADGSTNCAHTYKEVAEATIERVKTLKKMGKVHVLMAHDWEWYEANKSGEVFLPGSIPPVA
ncbi:beta-lactamase-like protein [Hysterangium stoloniferum]|nr:beta-lactamase-like protein [Hysterangium stoloniferum]